MEYSTQLILNTESKNYQKFLFGTLWKLALVLNINIAELFKPIYKDTDNNDNNT